MVSTRKWATARKTCRPATTCVSGCGACRLRATGTAFHGMAKVIGHWQAVFSLWRPHWITSARSFFEAQPRFATDKMGQNFIFHRIFVCHFAHGRGDYPGFTAQWHKLFSICRNTKRQGDFLVKVKKWKGKKMTAPINMLAILTKNIPLIGLMFLCQKHLYLCQNAKWKFANFIAPSRARVPLIYLVVGIIGFKLLNIVAPMFALLFRGTSVRHELIAFYTADLYPFIAAVQSVRDVVAAKTNTFDGSFV